MSSSAVVLQARLRGGAASSGITPEAAEAFLVDSFNRRAINVISVTHSQADDKSLLTLRCSDSDEMLDVLSCVNSDSNSPCTVCLLPPTNSGGPVSDSSVLVVRHEATSAVGDVNSLLCAILEPYGNICSMDTVGSVSTVTYSSKEAAIGAYRALKGRMFFGAPLEISLDRLTDSESTEADHSDGSAFSRPLLAQLDVAAPAIARDGVSAASSPNKSSPRLSERRGVQGLSLSTLTLDKTSVAAQDADDFTRLRSGFSSLTMGSDMQSPNWATSQDVPESQFWFAGGDTAAGNFSNHQLISPSSASAEWSHWSAEEPGSRAVRREIAGPGHNALVSDLIASFAPPNAQRSDAGVLQANASQYLASGRDGNIQQQYQQQHRSQHQSPGFYQYRQQQQQQVQHHRAPVSSDSRYGVLNAQNQHSHADLESVTSQGSAGSTWSARHDGSVASGPSVARDVYSHSEPALNLSMSSTYSDMSPKSQLQHQRPIVDSFHETKRVPYYQNIPSPKAPSVPSPSTNTALRITSAPYVPSSPVKAGTAQGNATFFPSGNMSESNQPTFEGFNTDSYYHHSSSVGRNDNSSQQKTRIPSYPYADSETDSENTAGSGSKPSGEYSIHSGQYEPDIRNVFVGNIGRLSSDGVQQLIKYFANIGVTVLKVDIKISFAFLEVRDTPGLQERIESIALACGGHPPPFGRDGRLLRIEFVQQSSAGKQNIKMRRENMLQPTCSLFVVGFDHRRTSASTLAGLFGKFGTVEHVEVKNNYAFVKFFKLDDSIAAQKAMHGFVWHDRTLSVEFSNRKSLGTLGMALLQHQHMQGLGPRPPVMQIQHVHDRGVPHIPNGATQHVAHHSAGQSHVQQHQPSYASSQQFTSIRMGVDHSGSAPQSNYPTSSSAPSWASAQGPNMTTATRIGHEFNVPNSHNGNVRASSSYDITDPRFGQQSGVGNNFNGSQGGRNVVPADSSFHSSNAYTSRPGDSSRLPKYEITGEGGHVIRSYEPVSASRGNQYQPQQQHMPQPMQSRQFDHKVPSRPEYNSIGSAPHNVRPYRQGVDTYSEDSGSQSDQLYAHLGSRFNSRPPLGSKNLQPYQDQQRSAPPFDVSGGASISSLGSNGSDGSRSYSSLHIGAESFNPGMSSTLNGARPSLLPQQQQSLPYGFDRDNRQYSSLNAAPLSFQESYGGMLATSNSATVGSSSMKMQSSFATNPSAHVQPGPSNFMFNAQSFPISPILSAGGSAEQKSFFSADNSA